MPQPEGDCAGTLPRRTVNLKIILVVHGFPPENIAGTEVYTYNLAKALSRDHEVAVFCRTAVFSRNEYELSCREVEGFKLFSINNTFRDYASFESTYKDERVAEKFGKVLDEFRPDVVHIQHLLYLSARMIDEAKKRGIPVVFTLNDYWLICPQGQLFQDNKFVCDGKGEAVKCSKCVLYQLGIQRNVSSTYTVLKKIAPEWFFQMIKNLYLVYAKRAYLNQDKTKNFLADRVNFMRELCRKVDLFIAPSKYLRGTFIAFGIPEEKIKFVSYGFDLGRATKLPKTPSPVLRFGFIGNLMPAKGAHVLIKSFCALQTGKAELKIYGKAFSYKSALGNYVGGLKSMAIDKDVRFMGEFDNRNIAEILAGIDVLVVPSIWYENAPLVIQEARLAGTPVIASRIGGIPELVKDGETGFLFEPSSEKDLKEKLEYIIGHRDILNEFEALGPGVKGIEENAGEVLALYRRVGAQA